MEGLSPGEKVLLEGRAGYQTQLTRGRLTLTNNRLLWERSLSIDPFGGHELEIDLASIRRCEREGDAIVIDAGHGEVFFFVDWLPLSIITGYRNTKEWLRYLTEAIAAVQKTEAAP
ncbi:MAG TPA: hypothetical protein VMT90_06100 [Dehalococcoidia bacterium]|jgi:hypothetical protein|nr:hypothetical protein [Dehalococcoidia bacterium]